VTPDEAVLASIKLNAFDEKRGCYRCGCEQRGKRWYLCSYHDGFGDGFDAGSALLEETQ